MTDNTAYMLKDGLVIQAIATVADLAPDYKDKIITDFTKRRDAVRHEADGAAAQAAADKAYLNNRDPLDTVLLDAIKEANSKAHDKESQLKLAMSVGILTGTDTNSADLMLTDLRNKERLDKESSSLFSSRSGAGLAADGIYQQMGSSIKQTIDVAISRHATTVESYEPFARDLKPTKHATVEAVDPKLINELADATRGLPPQMGDAITQIVAHVPEHIKEITSKAREFAADQSEHNGVASATKAAALSRALVSAAVDYAGMEGGEATIVSKQLDKISGSTHSANAVNAAAFGKKEVAENPARPYAQEVGDLEDPASKARRAEGERLQHDNTELLVKQLTDGLTNQTALSKRTVLSDHLEPAAPAAAAVTQASAPVTPVYDRKTPATVAELPADAYGKVSELAVEGGGKMSAEQLQKALKVAGLELGSFNGDGVDNDARNVTRTALLAWRAKNGGEHRTDNSLVIHADEVAKLSELASHYHKAHAVKPDKDAPRQNNPVKINPAPAPASKDWSDNRPVGSTTVAAAAPVAPEPAPQKTKLTEQQQLEFSRLAVVTNNLKARDGGDEAIAILVDYKKKHALGDSPTFDSATNGKLKSELADRFGTFGNDDDRPVRMAAAMQKAEDLAKSKERDQATALAAAPMPAVKPEIMALASKHYAETHDGATLDAKALAAFVNAEYKKEHNIGARNILSMPSQEKQFEAYAGVIDSGSMTASLTGSRGKAAAHHEEVVKPKPRVPVVPLVIEVDTALKSPGSTPSSKGDNLIASR